MKKCWICGRTGKEVDEAYTNRRHDFISDWSGSGDSPDELIIDINSVFQDDPIPVCFICENAIETIAKNRIDETIEVHVKRVLKGLLLSSLKEAEG